MRIHTRKDQEHEGAEHSHSIIEVRKVIKEVDHHHLEDGFHLQGVNGSVPHHFDLRYSSMRSYAGQDTSRRILPIEKRPF